MTSRLIPAAAILYLLNAPAFTQLLNGVIEKDGETWTGKLGGRVLTPDRR